MITNDTIAALANKMQTTDLNIRREYFQHLFLSYFYQQAATEAVFFKGGTALRLIYHSPRFSEDLDFSARGYDHTSIEQAVVETLVALEREGIAATIEEAKPTSGGYLAKIAFSALEHTVPLDLEVSLRAGEKQGEAAIITSELVPSYNALQLAQPQLINEKIAALLSRRKPRDFYDLYFILRANLLPPEERGILREALAVLKETGGAIGQRELKEFLPRSHWLIIKDLPTVLEREIARLL